MLFWTTFLEIPLNFNRFWLFRSNAGLQVGVVDVEFWTMVRSEHLGKPFPMIVFEATGDFPETWFEKNLNNGLLARYLFGRINARNYTGH